MTKYDNPNEILICLFVKLFYMTFASLGQEIRIFVLWSRNQERQQTQNERKTCLLFLGLLSPSVKFYLPWLLAQSFENYVEILWDYYGKARHFHTRFCLKSTLYEDF